MDSYINAEEYRDEFADGVYEICEDDQDWNRANAIIELFDSAPRADVAPVVHARWIGIEYDGYADGSPVYSVWECGHCGEEHRGEESTLTNFCPHCGSKMEGE